MELSVKIWGLLPWIATIISADDITSHKFGLETSQHVTQYQEMMSASSKLMCVKECLKYSWCDSCAYGSARGECFLQVESQALIEGIDDGLKVFRVKSLCNPSDVDHTMFNITWQPSGLEGDIRCNDDDYMYSGDSPTVHCKHPGLWVTDGTCRQRIWRNTTVYTRHHFPRAMFSGWAMCVRGVSCTACARFSFSLKDDNEIYLVRLDVRFNHTKYTKKIVLSNNANGAWVSDFVVDEFTFVEGEPFEVELRVPDFNTMQMYVNKTLTVNYSAPYSLASASFFAMQGGVDIVISFVDVWAGCRRKT